MQSYLHATTLQKTTNLPLRKAWGKGGKTATAWGQGGIAPV
jgi:hypothetical protein